MFRIKSPLFAALIVITILTGCSSGKSAFEHGNYYEAVLTSVNRLRKNDDHAKSIETLRQAYPMAVQFYQDKANASIASNADFKWTVVVESYTTINVMYDEIRRCPGALKVIPNPQNYYAKLDEAKKNAAEENYAAGITAMTFATRDKAKSAYYLFKKANDYVPGYKDVIKMTEAARWNATVKVVMEPIPVQAKNISVSAQFFDDKISEYVHSASINEFVKFYTRKEAQTMKLNPDHIIKIDFDEFVVGQVYMNEKETKLERDSVVISSYVTQSVTNSSGKTGTTTSGTTSGTTSATSGTTGSTSGTTGTTSGTSGTMGGSKGPGGSNTKGPESSGTTGTTTSGTTGTKTNGTSGSNTSGTSGNTSDKTSDSDNEKVTVCHIPPGNASNPHSLVIARSALKAHLAHGDKEGACDEGKNKVNDDKSSDKPKDDKVGDKKEDKSEDKSKEDKQKEDKADKTDDKSKDDKQKDEKADDKSVDKSKDDKSSEGKPEDKSKEDKQKDEKAEDKSVDKTKEDKSSEGKPEDKSKDEKSKDEKSKDEKSKDEKSKDGKEKPKDDKTKDKKSGGDGQASATSRPIFYASAKNDLKWLDYSNIENSNNDTVKVYATVKATLYYYKKTTTSKGVITFRIIDAKTNALLSVEKMPGEYVWISEWATFNGDERALTREQIQLTKQREKTPPPAQDLFMEFARPIYDQVVTKIKNFYTGY